MGRATTIALVVAMVTGCAQAQSAAPPAKPNPTAQTASQPAQQKPAAPPATQAGQKPAQKPVQAPAGQPAAGQPAAQKPPATKPAAQKPGAKPSGQQQAQATGPAVTPPPDYVIGPDDVVGVLFWREKDLSVENTVVRPDGMITLPLLNDVKAAGLTPDQLRDAVQAAAAKYVTDPNATVVVRQINSRRFYITGMVNKPGPYPLTSSTTVLQAIAMAGGLQEFAKEKDIVVMRTEKGQQKTYKFNYKDVIQGKNLKQNIEIWPGDTIVVP